ncbi:MAG: sugar ABC transporter substrate-binding protein [bacterium]
MKKYIIILIILCACGAFFLRAKKTPDNAKHSEVVFWTLQMSDFSPYMNEVIANFEKQNPKIKIKWVDVPFSEGEKRTLAAILSDNPPDLINLNPDFSATLAQKGALEKIDESTVGQFSQEIINSLKYKDELYAIPWYATSAITIYNKALYKKAGYSTPPVTYERLAGIAQIIKGETHAYAFMPTITENDTMLKILNKYGINSWENINSKKSVKIFDFYKRLYLQNLIPKETITQTQREALEKYMSGQIVFFQSGANFLNMIKENSPSMYKDTDVAGQIKGDLGQNDFSLMNLVIPLKASKKQDALKFALFLTNEENQLKLARLTNIIATNKHALKNDFYTQYDSSDLMAKARVISAKQLNKIQPALRQNKGQKEINLLINTAVQEILLNDSNTQQVLDEVAKKWKILAE